MYGNFGVFQKRRGGAIIAVGQLEYVAVDGIQAMLHCYGKAAKMDLQDLKTRLLKRLGLVYLFSSLTSDFVGLGTDGSVRPETSGF